MGTGFVYDLNLGTEADLAFVVNCFLWFFVGLFWFFLGSVYGAYGLRTCLIGTNSIAFIEVPASPT